MALEDPQKNTAKRYKKPRNCPAFFSDLWGLNYQSYQPFNSQFFLGFNFYFGHKTPGGLKTWENYAQSCCMCFSERKQFFELLESR